MTAHLLLVEDDYSLRLSLAASLRAEGYEVTASPSAEEARLAVAEREPDLVVLDWGLPGESGLDLLRAWRTAGRELPVIFLTARDAVDDRVTGLLSGAHDYVVKPFATEELLARIAVQLRDRSRRPEERRLELSTCTVDLRRGEVRHGDRTESLTTQELLLLTYLADHPGQPLARADLLRDVWGFRSAVRTRALDNTVLRLRGKIEATPASPRHVLTVHGVGYRFEP
jgi:DNA-binding response OmpR family regulator